MVPALSQKRITVLYTGYASQEGAAHPVNQFYTNTVDLSSCKDMGLSDFADPYTMAGYVLSDDVEFDGVNGDQLTALLEERSAMDIEYYTDIFENADFHSMQKTTGHPLSAMKNRERFISPFPYLTASVITPS